MFEIINLCDVKCTFCGRRFCLSSQGETHFPASCVEKNLWDRRSSQVTDPDIKGCFDRTEEELCNLEDLMGIISSKKSLNPQMTVHLQEMEQTVNLLHWTRVLVCFSPKDEFEVGLTLARVKNAVEREVVFLASEGKARDLFRKARMDSSRRVLELLGDIVVENMTSLF